MVLPGLWYVKFLNLFSYFPVHTLSIPVVSTSISVETISFMISFKLILFLKEKCYAKELGRKNCCNLLKCSYIFKPYSQVKIIVPGLFAHSTRVI